MAKKQLTIEEVNKLDCIEFTNTFKNLIENYGIAAFQMSRRTFHNIMDMYNDLCNLLDRTDLYRKELILRDHPGLLQQLEELVGLSAEDKHKLIHYIEQYEIKFGFSFLICDKEYKIADMLNEIKQRLKNNRLVEINVSVEEIKKISKYHILAMIKHEYA